MKMPKYLVKISQDVFCGIEDEVIVTLDEPHEIDELDYSYWEGLPDVVDAMEEIRNSVEAESQDAFDDDFDDDIGIYIESVTLQAE